MISRGRGEAGASLAPTLSIIIVNWNTKDMTRDCLNSVYAGLGGLSAEVIVVDNASSDGSAAMIADDFDDAILIANSENVGFAAANNQGLRVAQGRYVLLLNTDTLIHGNVLPASVAWLESQVDVGAMGCRVLNTDGSVQMTCSMYPSILNQSLQLLGLSKLRYPRFLGRYMMLDWSRDTKREVEVISGCYLLVRQKVVREVGPLDESFFFFGEETDWCKRIREAGWRLMFVPVGEITHHGSVSARKLDYRRDVMLTQSKVRLHRKHGGLGAAIIVWIIGFLFNSSRAAFWSLRALGGSEKAYARARHFRAVTRAMPQTWVHQP